MIRIDLPSKSKLMPFNTLYQSILLISLGALVSCSGKKGADSSAIKEDDFIVQFMDSAVKPGDDFFKFATGTWMK